jgi:hypothetical protein
VVRRVVVTRTSGTTTWRRARRGVGVVVRVAVRVVVRVVVVFGVVVDEGAVVPRAAQAEVRVVRYSGVAEAGEGPQTLGPRAMVAPEAAPMARLYVSERGMQVVLREGVVAVALVVNSARLARTWETRPALKGRGEPPKSVTPVL